MNKYHAKPVRIGGLRFASRREYGRYQELLLLLRAGLIADLDLQPRYPLAVNGEPVCTYVADFRYRDVKTGTIVVEDVKGVRTAAYRIKKKLMWAVLRIEVVEVR